jgi:hypothetical protein
MSRSTRISEKIIAAGVRLATLHDEVNRTAATRDRDAVSRREWEQACEAFHSFESPLDPYIRQAREDNLYADKNLIEFVVCFLEVDPRFFRSGYLKQMLITRLKRSELDAATKQRLRAVLLDAVARRGSREFKHYCRLASVIADQEVVTSLEDTIGRGDGPEQSRAKLMLSSIQQKEKRRANGA